MLPQQFFVKRTQTDLRYMIHTRPIRTTHQTMFLFLMSLLSQEMLHLKLRRNLITSTPNTTPVCAKLFSRIANFHQQNRSFSCCENFKMFTHKINDFGVVDILFLITLKADAQLEKQRIRMFPFIIQIKCNRSVTTWNINVQVNVSY